MLDRGMFVSVCRSGADDVPVHGRYGILCQYHGDGVWSVATEESPRGRAEPDFKLLPVDADFWIGSEERFSLSHLFDGYQPFTEEQGR